MGNRKTALITGGVTGIGKAIALELAKQGVNVFINYSRSEQDALEAREEQLLLGVTCFLQKADVSKDMKLSK
jgi:3-oxoacyl-[acyl-carrier protein] reductase